MQLEKDGFLSDKQFDKIESLLKNEVSPNGIMDLERTGRLADKPSAFSRLAEKGFSTEDKMTLQKKHANSERHVEEIEYLIKHGFTRDDIMYLAKRDSVEVKNLIDIHELVYKGFTRDDILALEKTGLFREQKIDRVKNFLKKVLCGMIYCN